MLLSPGTGRGRTPPVKRGLGTGVLPCGEQELGGLPKAWHPAKGSPPSKGKLQLESKLSRLALPKPAIGDEAKPWKGQGAHRGHGILDGKTESKILEWFGRGP